MRCKLENEGCGDVDMGRTLLHYTKIWRVKIQVSGRSTSENLYRNVSGEILSHEEVFKEKAVLF